MSVGTLHTLPTAVIPHGVSVGLQYSPPDADGRVAPVVAVAPVTGDGAVTLTPTWATATGSGTVAAGATSVSFYNSGSGTATVLGGSLPAGATLTLPAVPGCVWAAVAYDATGTTLLIVKGVAA